jgi:hypothetical protein
VIGPKFLNAHKQGAHAQPKAQGQKGKRKIPVALADNIQSCFGRLSHDSSVDAKVAMQRFSKKLPFKAGGNRERFRLN